MAMNPTSLHVTLTHAIAYLTRPLLLSSYPTTTVIKLQLMLEANLTALYAPTWEPREPFRGSGRRCLTLSPTYLPPRAIYSACLSAGIQWFDWIALLGGREFDFFVDPASVSLRYGNKATAPLFTVWSGDDESELQNASAFSEPLLSQDKTTVAGTAKTFAQQVLEDDAENDDELFAMLSEEINVPTWMTPILDKFPVPVRSFSPLSEISQFSRSSSPSSVTSSVASSLINTTDTEYATEIPPTAFYGVDVAQPKQTFKLSRRERARRARVFVDTSKITVTPYDGGKTTVLTGGVMLGGPQKAAVWPARTSYGWRFNSM